MSETPARGTVCGARPAIQRERPFLHDSLDELKRQRAFLEDALETMVADGRVISATRRVLEELHTEITIRYRTMG